MSLENDSVCTPAETEFMFIPVISSNKVSEHKKKHLSELVKTVHDINCRHMVQYGPQNAHVSPGKVSTTLMGILPLQ